MPGAFVRALLVALPIYLGGAAAVQAATFNVDTTADDVAATACDDAAPGDCSLRGALQAAGALAEPSTINVPAGTYSLSQTGPCTFTRPPATNSSTFSTLALCLTGAVTLHGAGADATVIDAGGRGRAVFVAPGAVAEIRGVTIRNGLSDRSVGTNPEGGGIRNEGGLVLVESVVTNNTLDPVATGSTGAGIYNAPDASLALLRSTVEANLATAHQGGGGISTDLRSTLSVLDSVIRGNAIRGHGGGILNNGGTVIIAGSTVSGNMADTLGGGIANFGAGIGDTVFLGDLTLLNSTVSGNTAANAGGGIWNHFFTTVQLNNVTIANNRATAAGGSGGGIASRESDGIFVRNTIIAGNTAGSAPDCDTRNAPGSTPLTSRGHNLIQDTANCDVVGDPTGHITGEDPKLGVLTSNGGPTPTHALAADSPAVDAGNPALPGSGDNACAATDQRGALRPLGARCDIGAFERSGAFSVVSIAPGRGGNTGPVSAIVSGDGFVSGATVRLRRAGQPDVVGHAVHADGGGSALSVTFDLAGRPTGGWDVVVANPDGSEAALPAGFTVEEGRAPELWANVVGLLLRPGRVSRFVIFYGNRGNVDAVGVPLSLSIPAGWGATRAFAITPPPAQPGQVRDDWSQVPLTVEIPGGDGGLVQVPLLLPVVPAGFTGTLQIGLVQPVGATDTVMLASIGEPLFRPGLDPEAVDAAVEGARAYLESSGVAVSPTVLGELEQYTVNQLQLVAQSGRAAFAASLGSDLPIYSAAHLHFDRIFFGAARAAAGPQASSRRDPPAGWLSAVRRVASRWLSAVRRSAVLLVSWLGPSEAHAATRAGCGKVLAPGTSSSSQCEEPFLPPETPLPPGCDLKDPSTLKNCKPLEDHCEALGTHQVVRDSSGNPFCAPKNPPEHCPAVPLDNPFLGSGNLDCRPFPLFPRNSADPNDKVGRVGAGGAQFLLPSTPLAYTVNFENLETATAPAQVVVITDQLDVTTVDLETFRLGPISFGRIAVVPSAGAQHYTGGVDLRPEQNLIVTIQAGLDRSTGVVTWLFTSIDPETGQLTDDPDAGFLPPNVNPPEGNGSVVFTVEPKAGLATGTAICNQASIVFDVNDPILTPQWCNTIDRTPPSSQVAALAPTQASPSFTVQWSGTDVGAGVATYTVFVSRNGGPFTPFLTDTAETSATFPGAVGETYAFYSVARDLVGNEEAVPAAPQARTTVAGAAVHDLAVVEIVAPSVTLTRSEPAKTKPVKVRIQNRSPHAETIPDLATLTALVSLEVTSLGGCPKPLAVLSPPKKFPVVLKPKQKLSVEFRLAFDCANDPARSTGKDPGHEDYSLAARVDHAALDGQADSHPADDVCPRGVTPPFELDPHPNGKIKDRGCGAKKADKTFGDPVLVDVFVKP